MALLQIDHSKGKLQGKGNSFLGLLQRKHIKSGGVYGYSSQGHKNMTSQNCSAGASAPELTDARHAHKVKRAIQLLCKSNQSSTASRRRV